jgi:hypothetical protein
MRNMRCIALLLLAFCGLALAKDAPKQVVNWPSEDKPLLRFTVDKIKELPSYGGHHNYILDTSVENLTGNLIPKATFSLYLIDKKNVRIGDGYLSFENLAAKQTIKIGVNAETTGVPASIALNATDIPPALGVLPAKQVSITVYSVPSGANLKLDGKDVGVTPMVVSTQPGSHILEFSKTGFSKGTYPLALSPDQLSGGSVSFELGASAHDSVELRDGTVLTADVESVSATEVMVRIAGNVQTFDRNQVKRIGFTVRQQQ